MYWNDEHVAINATKNFIILPNISLLKCNANCSDVYRWTVVVANNDTLPGLAVRGDWLKVEGALSNSWSVHAFVKIHKIIAENHI